MYDIYMHVVCAHVMYVCTRTCTDINTVVCVKKCKSVIFKTLYVCVHHHCNIYL